MATATKSKIKKALPQVRKIAFGKKVKKKVKGKTKTPLKWYKSIYATDGQFSAVVYFKQPKKKTYPYQIQYRERGRYGTVEKTAWNSWTDWKCAVGVSGIPKDSTESLYPVNYWMKSNKGINKKGIQQKAFTFTNASIGSSYDARQYEFRIRTFYKKGARHGEWLNSKLTVYKKAKMNDWRLLASQDGGFIYRFNTDWVRDDATITINAVYTNGRQLLKKDKPLKKIKIKPIELTSTTIPPARTGYVGAQVEVLGSKLKTSVEDGQTLHIKGFLETGDGATTAFDKTLTLINPSSGSGESSETGGTDSFTLTVGTPSWDSNTGIVSVVATKTGTDIADLCATLSYIYNEKRYTIQPLTEDVDIEGGTGTFYFTPPFGKDYTIEVKGLGIYDALVSQTVSGTAQKAYGYWFNKEGSADTCGVAWANPSLQINTTPAYDSALPVGRENTVIFYSGNASTTLSFTAVVLDNDDTYGGANARHAMWKQIKDNQGTFYLRNALGELYKVGLTKVGLTMTSPYIYELTVEMQEVD